MLDVLKKIFGPLHSLRINPHMAVRLLVFWLVLVSLLWPLLAVAQAVTTEPTASQKLWEVLLKILFPTLWTVAAPFFTKGVTWGLLKVVSVVPASVKVAISSVVGALIAGLAGAIPEFPLTIESAAEMGAAQGASAQMLAIMNPAAVQPKPKTVSR